MSLPVAEISRRQSSTKSVNEIALCDKLVSLAKGISLVADSYGASSRTTSDRAGREVTGGRAGMFMWMFSLAHDAADRPVHLTDEALGLRASHP